MQPPPRESYDVIVIGGGLIGLACAWRVAEGGPSVVVLERASLGDGASGVAAGMLAPVTEADFGDEPLLRAGLASRELWPGFAAELEERSGRPTHFRESGALVVAADRDDAGELRRLHAHQRELGLAAEWLQPSGCRSLEPGLSPRIAGGVLAPQDAQVDPAAVVAALAGALEAAGGRLMEGVAVAAVENDGSRVTGVRLGDGRALEAEQVVLAAGPWSTPLDPSGSGPRIRPVKGQILQLRARTGSAEPIERIVRSPRCYLVGRGDGRVVLGATVEEQGFDTALTAGGIHGLLEAAWELVPEVGELELMSARAGLRPATSDNLPVVGRGSLQGLVWAGGHYRNGVLLAPITAREVAVLIDGGQLSEHFTAFSPERFAAVAA